ncbi:hypothetical protein N826_25765 [Skermanella aerolata KACC 11604]|nr:hypothetical protein N826_25765 [Skermanella aerolata KACC 11604]
MLALGIIEHRLADGQAYDGPDRDAGRVGDLMIPGAPRF